MRVIVLVIASLALVPLTGCTKKNPSSCCLTLEDCQSFGVDDVRECEGEQVCEANQCVPLPDAPMTDARAIDADMTCALAGGEIVFQTDRDGDNEIATIRADGTGFRALTDNTWSDRAPLASPDGTKIAWISSPAGQTELNVMNRDGTGSHDVATGSIADVRWSPDSSRLAYTLGTGSSAEVYVVEASGAPPLNVTNVAESDRVPDWAPDSSRIVFLSERDVTHPCLPCGDDLYLMDANGGNPTRLSGASGFFGRPRWAPGGAWIAHTRVESGPPANALWLIAPGGSSFDMHVRTTMALEYEWAPDGGSLVVAYGGDVYTVDAGGANLALVGDGAGNEDAPRWNLAGDRLLWQSDRDGNPDIVVGTPDQAVPTNLTNDPSNDVGGSWAGCP